MSTSVTLKNAASLRAKELHAEEENPNADSVVASPTDRKANNIAVSTIQNVPLSIVQLGLQFERLNNRKLQQYCDESKKIQDQLEMLTNLSGQLSASDKDAKVSEEALKIADNLKKQGIEILHDNERSVKPERMVEIKAQISSQSDRLKTEIQQLFTTKIQVLIGETNSLFESLRMIIKYYSQFMATVIGNQKRQ